MVSVGNDGVVEVVTLLVVIVDGGSVDEEVELEVEDVIDASVVDEDVVDDLVFLWCPQGNHGFRGSSTNSVFVLVLVLVTVVASAV